MTKDPNEKIYIMDGWYILRKDYCNFTKSISKAVSSVPLESMEPFISIPEKKLNKGEPVK